MMKFAPATPEIEPIQVSESVRGEFDAIHPQWLTKYPWTRIPHRYWLEAKPGTVITVRAESAGPALGLSVKNRREPSKWHGPGTFATDSLNYTDHNGPHAELIVTLPDSDDGGYLIEVSSSEPGRYSLKINEGASLTRNWWQAPVPLSPSAGKFMSPFRKDGSLAEWVSRGLIVKRDTELGQSTGKLAGKLVEGSQAGGAAGEMVGYIVGHAVAVKRAGGWDAIRAGSDQAFQTLDDLALYLHINHSDKPQYRQILRQTYGIYPDLEGPMSVFLHCFASRGCRH